MRQKQVHIFIYILFGILSAYSVARLFSFSKADDGYIIADWLINFSGGFARRGLCGEMILALSKLTGIYPGRVVLAFQAFFVILFFALLIGLLRTRKLNFFTLMLLVSPAIFLFPVNDSTALGRKEIILFATFAAFLLRITKARRLLGTDYMAFGAVLILATFFHELTFFYTPYFLIAVYLHRSKNVSLKRTAVTLSGVWLAAAAIFTFGKTINEETICQELLHLGMGRQICDGMLSFTRLYGEVDVLLFARQNHYYLSYGAGLVLGFLPLLFHDRFLAVPAGVKRLLLLFGFTLLFSAPLFVLATDWGRWLSIHLTFWFLLQVSLLPKQEVTGTNKALMPGWPQVIPQRPRLNIIGGLAIVLLYATGWKMLVYGSFNFLSFQVFRKAFTTAAAFFQ